ncbi:MAG: DNA-binding response regulator, partial [Microcystaceae cyanobacterium]
EDDPSNPELILTARGTGYLFQRIHELGEESSLLR